MTERPSEEDLKAAFSRAFYAGMARRIGATLAVMLAAIIGGEFSGRFAGEWSSFLGAVIAGTVTALLLLAVTRRRGHRSSDVG